ncbi:MAG: alpha/beta fold hydrolase [Pseudomonadota bacterium]
MTRLLVLTSIVLMIALLVGLAITGERDPWTGTTEFRGHKHTSRELTLGNGEVVTVVRGSIKVPEVRNKDDSRQINIGYAAVAGNAPAGAIPIVLLAGGPGGSHIRNLDRPWVKERIALFRQLGDVVMVDLRGIHSSTPQFELSGVDDPWRNVRSESELLQLLEDAGAAGRAQLQASGFNLSGYVVTEAAADVVAIADHLTYPQINLQGTSFGSHFTFAVVRYHPERVNRFMVTGVEGYDHTFDDGHAVRTALAKIAVEAESVWAGAHNAADPLTAFENLLAKSAANPAQTYGVSPHEWLMVQLNGDMMGFGYNLSSRAGMHSWPADTAQLIAGSGSWRANLLRWFSGFFVGSDASEAAVGLFDCTSWISSARAQVLQHNAPPNFPNNLQTMQAICAGWDVQPLPESFQLGEVSMVPGLFVHGTYDVSTPYQNALDILPLFPNGQLVTVEGGSHNVFSEMLAERPEFAAEVIGWFQGGPPPPNTTLPPLKFAPLTD